MIPALILALNTAVAVAFLMQVVALVQEPYPDPLAHASVVEDSPL